MQGAFHFALFRLFRIRGRVEAGGGSAVVLDHFFNTDLNPEKVLRPK